MADVYLSSGYRSVPLYYIVAAFSADEYQAAVAKACTARRGVDDACVSVVIFGEMQADEDMVACPIHHFVTVK